MPHQSMSELLSVSYKVLQDFAAISLPPVETEAGGLVTVAMDARYLLTWVSLQHVDIEPKLAAELEQAIRQAVNDAVLQVGRRNAEHLLAAVERDLDG